MITVKLALTCDSKGNPNGDTDDSDHVYEVYAYVIDGSDNAEEDDNNIIECVAPEVPDE